MRVKGQLFARADPRLGICKNYKISSIRGGHILLLLLSPCLSALDELSVSHHIHLPLIHSIISHSLNYSVSKTTTTFGILSVSFLYCRSSASCIALLFSIIAFNSVNPSPVSFNIFSPPFGLRGGHAIYTFFFLAQIRSDEMKPPVSLFRPSLQHPSIFSANDSPDRRQ